MFANHSHLSDILIYDHNEISPFCHNHIGVHAGPGSQIEAVLNNI